MKRHALLPTTLFLGAALAGCSGPQPSVQAEGSPAPAPAVASAVNDGRKVEIVANDTMKFSIVEIHAKPGERLSITLVNKGLTPKFSMGHNWILIKPEVNVDAFLATAAESPTTEYVPAASRGQILASTKLLGPGEQDTATFAAPATAGQYPFLCSYPGHAQVGMRGVLIVD